MKTKFNHTWYTAPSTRGGYDDERTNSHRANENTSTCDCWCVPGCVHPLCDFIIKSY